MAKVSPEKSKPTGNYYFLLEQAWFGPQISIERLLTNKNKLGKLNDLKLLVLSQCKTTSAYEEPRSSGNEYTNSLVVKITAHYTSPCYFLYALCKFPNLQ